MRSVTHLDEISQVLLPLPLAFLYLIHFLVGCFVTSFRTEVVVKSSGALEPLPFCVFDVTVPRTRGANVFPTLTASAKGASATRTYAPVCESGAKMSIRSLAEDWTAWIFVQGVHIDPVMSSIRATSTSLVAPWVPVLVQATLGQSADVAVAVVTTQPKPLVEQPIGAPASTFLWNSEFSTLKNGVFTHDVAVTVNCVLELFGENCSVELTTSVGLAWLK
jgi:hypothetical protein